MPTLAEVSGSDCPEDIDGISILNVLTGKELEEERPYLYWDYGHCRARYDQALLFGKWKGIRFGQGSKIQLYNLDIDSGEENDMAEQHPEIIMQIDSLMESFLQRSDRYPIGSLYDGGPIWRKSRQN